MDASVFGLDGHPFETEFARPDDATLFEAQAALVAELRAGLKTPQGIIVLVGETGVGKSALVEGLSQRLGEATARAYLPEPGPGLRGILAEAIEQLSSANGKGAGKGNDTHLSGALREMAKANAAKGTSTLVVLDDAHALSAKTIERFARLFPKDPAEPSKLHLLLVGRVELLDRLNSASDRSVLRYLVQVCRMDGIGPEDSFRYIAERVSRAGGTVDRLFSDEALAAIVQKAAGRPARLNALCRAALENAARSGAKTVVAAGDEDGPEDQQAREPDQAEQVRRSSGRPAAAGRNRRSLGLWGVGLVAALIGFAALMSRGGDRDGADGGPEQAALPLAVVVGQDRPLNPPANPPAIAKLALVPAKPAQRPASDSKPEPARATPLPKANPASKPTAKAVAKGGPAPSAKQERRVVSAAAATKPAGRVVASGRLPVGPLAAAIDDIKEKIPPSFSVQVGAFRTEANAARLVSKLASRGFRDAQVLANRSGAAVVFRVMSGGFASSAAARRHAKALAAKGFSTYVKKMTP